MEHCPICSVFEANLTSILTPDKHILRITKQVMSSYFQSILFMNLCMKKFKPILVNHIPAQKKEIILLHGKDEFIEEI